MKIIMPNGNGFPAIYTTAHAHTPHIHQNTNHFIVRRCYQILVY